MHIHSYIIISHFIPLSFFLSFFLSFSLSFFFRPSEVGVGREVDRACSPGRKEGGKCTGGGSARSVALSVRKVREKWREPRLKGAGGGRFLPPPPSPPPVCPLGPLPVQTWRKCRFPLLRSEETVRLPLNSDYLIKMM